MISDLCTTFGSNTTLLGNETISLLKEAYGERIIPRPLRGFRERAI